MNNKLIYGVTDIPRTYHELFLFAIQQLMAVFVATVLISNVCGTPTDACLMGACIGTIIYQFVTKFKSPMFISSCGATCSAVIGALSLNGGNNYTAVMVGGVVILVVYFLFSILVRVKGIESINAVFPPYIVGAVTMVIGLNLATFIPTYVQVGGVHSDIGIVVALATMLVIAISSHYFKGFAKMIPFLIGIIFGYIVCSILTVTGVANIVDFSIFKTCNSLLSVPDFSFFHFNLESLNIKTISQTVILFLPVSICALLEHYSDHKVLSNIIGTDLTVDPGLHRTLMGDGLASFFGTVTCGLPNTSYGESIATTGFSKVASTAVITLAAIMLGCLAFITPFQIFLQTIPSCVFGGCAMVLYGYIALSGLRTIVENNVDVSNNKIIIIIATILTIGVSGIFLFHESFGGVALSMIVGVILNVILV